MKKMFSLALALIMALALAIPTFAVEQDDSVNAADTTTGQITVTNPVVGETYNLYRLLDLESYNTASGAYAYKLNSKWAAFFEQTSINGVYVNIDAQDYVTWVDGASAAEFAKLAKEYAKNNTIAADYTCEKYASGTVSYDEIPLGYYLMDSSLGTLCSLTTTDNVVEIAEKNSVPDVKKEVEEDSTGAWGERDNADIGQTVNFKSTITIPAATVTDAESGKAGVQNLILHDKMDAVLVFDNESVVVTADGTELTEGEEYTLVVDDANVADDVCEKGCTFEVVFAQTYLDTLSAAAHEIIVTYSAEVSADAVADTEYENTTGITYGDDSESQWDTTYTKTYDFDLLKYTMNGEEEVELDGAEFELTYADANGGYDEDAAPIAFVAVDGGYRVATADDKDFTTILAAGSINILGLDADVYYLTETKAPDGYNQLAEPVRIEITDDSATLIANPDYGKEGAATADQAYIAAANDLVKVLNLTGAELPSTGGMGTTIFYVVGGVLMAGAAVLLVTKKKLANEQ